MVKLFLMQNNALPSSESECLPMHLLNKSSLFWHLSSGKQPTAHLHPASLSSSSHAWVPTWGCRLAILHSGDHVPLTKVDSWRLLPFQLCQSLLLPGVIIQYPCHVWQVLDSVCQWWHCWILSDIPMWIHRMQVLQPSDVSLHPSLVWLVHMWVDCCPYVQWMGIKSGILWSVQWHSISMPGIPVLNCGSSAQMVSGFCCQMLWGDSVHHLVSVKAPLQALP